LNINSLNKMEKMLELKGYSPNTITAYVRYAEKLYLHYQKSFEQITTEEIQNYLHYLTVDKKYSYSYININYNALKFLYKNILSKTWDVNKLPRLKKDKKLPVILSKSEVKNLFSVISNLKHKAILMTIYSAGLRISEAINLKIKDIDSNNMQIRIRQAKGKKDRYTLLSQANLIVLREYWKNYKPDNWLFPGVPTIKPISARTIQRVLKDNALKAGIKKNATVHTLRHCFATHLLEADVNIFHIQKLMGHASLKTTAIYFHLTRKDILNVKSPLDTMMDSEQDG